MVWRLLHGRMHVAVRVSLGVTFSLRLWLCFAVAA